MIKKIFILWKHLSSKRKIQIIFLLALMLLCAVLEIFSIGAILPFMAVLISPENSYRAEGAQQVITWFGVENQHEWVNFVTAIFLISIVISCISRVLLGLFQTKISHEIGCDLALRLLDSIISTPYEEIVRINSSEIISLLTDKVTLIIYSIVLSSLNLISSLIISGAIIFTITYVDPVSAVSLGLFFSITYLTVIYLTKGNIKAYGEQIRFQQSAVIKSIQECIGSLRDVIVYDLYQSVRKRFGDVDKSWRSTMAKVRVLELVPRYIIETIGILVIGFLAYINATQGDLLTKFPVFAVIVLGAQKLMPSFHQMYAAMTYLKGGNASLQEIIHYIDQKHNQDIIKEISFKSEISINELRFAYIGSQKNTLQCINLVIKKGGKIGIVGKSGSGKSTFIDLVMGFLRPTSGEILIDGTKLESNNINSWQNKISHVPQNVYLLDASIVDNIILSQGNAIDSEGLAKVLRMTDLNDFVAKLKDGMHTIVGERGSSLSGGQMQRIGIARALYRNPDVLILDEPTSALDQDTESKVIDSIFKIPNLTIIMIAHKFEALRHCEMIFEMKEGSLARLK